MAETENKVAETENKVAETENKVAELKRLVELCNENPSILHDPSVGFFKLYLERMGATIPAPSNSLEPIAEFREEHREKHKSPQKEKKQKKIEKEKQRQKDKAQMAEASMNEASDMSKDPNRKAQSKDPGWKYGFWPDLNVKDLIQCTLCNKRIHSGISRLKQHLAGGYIDVQMCPNTTPEIMKEMEDYIRKNVRKPYDSSTAASSPVATSGTSSKRKRTS